MKTFIKALLAASMLMPIAAQAQEQDGRERGPGRRGGDWGQRAERPDRGPRPERSAEIGVDAQIRAERPQWRDNRPDRLPPAPDARRDDQRGPAIADRDPGRRDWNNRDWGNRDGGDRNRGDRNWGGRRDDRPQERFDQPRPDRRPDQPRAAWRQPDADRGDWRGNDRRGPEARSWNDGRGWNGDRSWNGDRGWNGGGRDDRRGGAWNRGWRNDNRYDWNRYRQSNRGAYRLPRYYAPSGWGYGYRRFSVGVSLSAGLFGRNYWIEDPYAYRLPEAYGPYRWVRYYDDALLVDIRSGQVVDTVYGIFY